MVHWVQLEMHDGPKLPAFAALAAGVIAISWSAIFVRWANMPGAVSAFYRVLIAAVILWMFLPFQRASIACISRRTLFLSSLGGIFFAGDVALFNLAVLRTMAGNATFLANNSPLFVGLITWLLTRKLPSRRFWTALAIAFAGACLVVWVDLRRPESGFSADLMAVLAAACFAGYLLITERVREKMGTLILAALSTTASAVALLAFAVCARISLTVPTASSFAALLGLGLFCQLGGYFCLTYALGHLPATVSSIVLLGIAPLTAMNARMVFGEQMTLLQLLGGCFILIAVWIVSRHSNSAHQDARST